MNFKYGDFITNKAYHPMGEALMQLSSLDADLFQITVDHVRDEYAPDPDFIKGRVVQLLNFAPEHLKNKFMDMMFAYSDYGSEDCIPEFITFFLQYAPIVAALDVSLLQSMQHPKNVFKILDRTELKRCHEDIALLVMRTAIDNAMIAMKTDPMCMQPAIDHCQIGFKRHRLFDGNHSLPSGSYDHQDLLAAYNHLYLFR